MYPVHVPQLNIHVTPEFEKALSQLMRARKFRTKSEAIRFAVREALQLSVRSRQSCDYSEWLGLAAGAPQNPKPRFRSEDELWS